jgi:hypothetical protein
MRWYYYGDVTTIRERHQQYFEEYLLLETDECIRWPFGHSTRGYGKLSLGGRRGESRSVDIHVLACERIHGPRPPKLEVAHSCRNRDCFNPRHLRWDTRKGNLADRVADGTMPWGESHPRAKVTEADVLVMRAMYAKGGITMTALAKQYGLEKSTVRAIIRKETWRHV